MFTNENNNLGGVKEDWDRQNDLTKVLIGAAVIGGGAYAYNKFSTPKVPARPIPSINPTVTYRTPSTPSVPSSSSSSSSPSFLERTGGALLDWGKNALVSNLSPRDMSLPVSQSEQSGGVVMQSGISSGVGDVFKKIPPVGVFIGLSAVGLVMYKLFKNKLAS